MSKHADAETCMLIHEGTDRQHRYREGTMDKCAESEVRCGDEGQIKDANISNSAAAVPFISLFIMFVLTSCLPRLPILPDDVDILFTNSGQLVNLSISVFTVSLQYQLRNGQVF